MTTGGVIFGIVDMMQIREILSLSRLLAECRKKRLSRGSFVLLYFALFAFSELYLTCVLSVFNLSFVLYFPACTNVNGTV